MAIWNPKSGTWINNYDDEQEVWNPTEGKWNTLKSKDTKTQLPKAKQKEPKQDSFSVAKNKLSDTLNNSFTKSNGLSFSNVVTDLANTYDATKNLLFSVPVAGNYFKANEVAKDTAINAMTNLGTGAMKSVEGTADFLSDVVANPIEQRINYGIDYVKSGKKVADENLKDLKKQQKRDIKKNLTKEFQDKVGYTDVVDDLEKNSLIKRDNSPKQLPASISLINFVSFNTLTLPFFTK